MRDLLSFLDDCDRSLSRASDPAVLNWIDGRRTIPSGPEMDEISVCEKFAPSRYEDGATSEPNAEVLVSGDDVSGEGDEGIGSLNGLVLISLCSRRVSGEGFERGGIKLQNALSNHPAGRQVSRYITGVAESQKGPVKWILRRRDGDE